MDVPYPLLSKVEFFRQKPPSRSSSRTRRFAEQVTLTLLVRESGRRRAGGALVDLSEGVLEPVRFDEFYHPWPEADDTPR